MRITEHENITTKTVFLHALRNTKKDVIKLPLQNRPSLSK